MQCALALCFVGEKILHWMGCKEEYIGVGRRLVETICSRFRFVLRK